MPFGVALFVMAQSMILAQRFTQAHHSVEHLNLSLGQLYEALELQEKQRTAFFHNTSHELRTPLNGIIGFAALIGDGRFGPVTDGVRLQIEKIARLAGLLKLQVNTILDLARARRGQVELRALRPIKSTFGSRVHISDRSFPHFLARRSRRQEGSRWHRSSLARDWRSSGST